MRQNRRAFIRNCGILLAAAIATPAMGTSIFASAAYMPSPFANSQWNVDWSMVALEDIMTTRAREDNKEELKDG